MSDLSYSVEVNYFSSGRIDSGLAGSKASTDAWLKGVGGKIQGIAGSFNSMFDSAASTALSAFAGVATATTAILAAGMGKAVSEAFKFSAEIENAQLGMAALFAANNLGGEKGTKSPFAEGMRLAQLSVKEMRKDAQDLPGEFKDLQNIMATIAGPAAQSGMDATGIEKMASKAMVAGAILNIPQATVAREMAMILGGNAKHSMPLARMLPGLGDLHALNKMSMSDRRHKLNESLDTINTPEALASVKGNWSTIISTAKDKLRGGVAAFGDPLFQFAKDKIGGKIGADGQRHGGFNNWAASDQAVNFGMKLSDGIIRAMDLGEQKIRYWFPIVEQFADTMYDGIHGVFMRASPLLEGIFGGIAKFMKDPGAFDKLAHIATTMVAMRAGGGALSMGGSLLSGLGGIEGMGVAELGAVAIPAAAALALFTVGAYGATHALADADSAFHNAAVNQAGAIARNLKDLGTQTTKLGNSMEPVADLIGTYMLTVLRGWTYALELGVMGVNGFIYSLKQLPVIGKLLEGKPPAPSTQEDFLGDGTIDNRRMDAFNTALKPIKEMNTSNGEPEKKIEPPKVVNHNTYHVTIKVDGNEDPRRIVKAIDKGLNDLWKFNPKTDLGSPRDGRSNL